MQSESKDIPQFERSVLPFDTVSVTGGTGTVGSQFVKVLLDQFPHLERVNTTCRSGSPRACRLPRADRLNIVKGSINDIGVLRRMADEGEIVYHLAAWLANTPLPTLTDVYITNALATGVVAELCVRAEKKLIFTSSHSVYFAGEYAGRIRADEFSFRDDFVEWIEAVNEPYGQLIDGIVDGTSGFDEAREAIEDIHRELPPPFEPKIYDNDSYHIYCLTKLMAERFVLDRSGIILRLANVYGPGDESPQAVGEACQRLLEAEPGDELEVRQPFKKLVPAHLGDIIKCFIRASRLELPEPASPLFTVASQEHYMREDALLRTVADALNEIRGTDHQYEIEELPPEDEMAFTYDLTKMKTHLLHGEPLTPFSDGVKGQLNWLLAREEGTAASETAVVIDFAADAEAGL